MAWSLEQISFMTRAIWRRVSVRSYRGEPVPAETLAEVLRAGEESIPLWPHIPVRFVLAADADAFLREHGGTLLGYGRILGAPHFIVAISEVTAGYMENMGFRMEQMILYATALGLGTCWMGGFYSRQKVGHLVGLGPAAHYNPDPLAHLRILHDAALCGREPRPASLPVGGGRDRRLR